MRAPSSSARTSGCSTPLICVASGELLRWSKSSLKAMACSPLVFRDKGPSHGYQVCIKTLAGATAAAVMLNGAALGLDGTSATVRSSQALGFGHRNDLEQVRNSRTLRRAFEEQGTP